MTSESVSLTTKRQLMALISRLITERYRVEPPRLDYGAVARAAEALNVEAATLSHIRIGSTHKVSLDRLLDISAQLGIRIEFIVE